MREHALAVHALARLRGAARDDGSWSPAATRRQRRKVDKCRVADKKKTDRQTNTHYSFIGIDIAHWFTSMSTLARYDEPGLNLALRIFILHCYQVRPHSSVLR